MDADIQFLDPDTLRHMIDELEVTPEAWVSVDTPVKDVALKENKNLIERLSASVSASSEGDAPVICGQLYCGRATVLRGIWMPVGLPVEDGFLRAMIVSDRFTSPEVFNRIVLPKSASHVFEAYTDLKRLLRHERRLVVSSTINAFIYGYLWANCNTQQDAGTLIERRNDTDPLWLHIGCHNQNRTDISRISLMHNLPHLLFKGLLEVGKIIGVSFEMLRTRYELAP